MENLVYAIILLPLLGFLINGLFGKNLPKKLLEAWQPLLFSDLSVLR